MKINQIKIGNEDILSLQEIYCNTVLETKEGNRIAICMRDGTVELSVVGSKRWYRANIRNGEFVEIITMETIIETACSCGWQGKIAELGIDRENHLCYFCPQCRLTGGLWFAQSTEKINPYEKK